MQRAHPAPTNGDPSSAITPHSQKYGATRRDRSARSSMMHPCIGCLVWQEVVWRNGAVGRSRNDCHRFPVRSHFSAPIPKNTRPVATDLRSKLGVRQSAKVKVFGKAHGRIVHGMHVHVKPISACRAVAPVHDLRQA